ncbi:MAG: hypothetical protein V9E96_01495 [Chitinophagaceae bacterium]
MVVSPSGIWLSNTTSPVNPAGSATSSGATQHYKDHFANSRLWQNQGWVDYMTSTDLLVYGTIR